MGSLVLLVSGTKSTRCHTVRVQRNMLPVEPPGFILSQCIPAGENCIQVITPFDGQFGPFAIGPFRPVVTLHHSGGEMQVKVQPVYELVKASRGGGGEVPTPFLLAPSPVKGQKPAGGDMPIPFFKSWVSDADKKVVADAPVDRAVGHGGTFEEAFQQAAGAVLAGRRPDYPDQMHTVKVVEEGAMWGGIAGFTGERYVVAELVR